VASYARALALRPDHANALHNRGNTLHELKRFEEAVASYDRALAVQRDHPEVLSNRGVTLHVLGRFEEALASFDRSLASRPNSAETLVSRGKTLRVLKRPEEALASFEHALMLKDDIVDALFDRADTLYEMKRFEAARTSYDRALALRPDNAEALFRHGNALHALKRPEEALASYDRAIARRPDSVETLSNRGAVLHEIDRFEEALASYDGALAWRPDAVEVLSNRGNVLHDLKRFTEALESYERALALRPDYAEAHRNESLCRRLIGDFERGWAKNEWRWEAEQMRVDKRYLTQPLWLGVGDIAGRTILLYEEQGFGDTIQFCRYAPLVEQIGARVILEVPRPLHELLRTLPGDAHVVSRGDPLPDFEVHCPFLSLPLALGTRLETIPASTPYLHASPQAVADWDARLGPKRRSRIGLVWSGSPTHKNDRRRSVSLRALAPLFEIDATFVSLHKDVRPDDAAALKDRGDVLHFGDALKDFSETAALISNLDLVISVDTSVAHLAGALAKPVWVLLPHVPDWRWLLDRDDSPWYPTARLFRQDDTRAWDGVIARVRAALHEFASKCQPR
jgi:tetratricopeptide (TPR) repeat protein